MISLFSSPVFLIGLGGFSPGSHFLLTIPRLIKLVSKKRNNCNNVTFEAKNFQSRSYMTTIIQNFTLISLTSTVTLQPVGLSLRAAVLSLPIYLTPYALDFSLLRLCTSRKYLSEIVSLLRHIVCHLRSLQYVARKLNC